MTDTNGIDWPRPGVHPDIPADAYHNDTICREPSLSSSIARLFVDRSPLHAWTSHPRLNPAHKPLTGQKFDLGSVAHALLLQGEQIAEVIDADSWRTNAAKEAAVWARAAGKIPMLAGQWTECQAMVAAVRSQLEARDDTPAILADGKAEQTVIWQEDGITCRARIDWLRDDLAAIDDLKTTGASANPYDWARRTLWSIGADVQIAFYLRGIRKVTGRQPIWRYVVVETEPPYALGVLTPAASVLELGQRKVEHAIARWRECMRTGTWPGYQTGGELYRAEMDAWQEADFLARTWTPEAEGVAA